MNIGETGGIQGPSPIQPAQNRKATSAYSSPPAERTDRAEISIEARMLDKLRRLPAIREEKVDELRRLIDDGTYDTDERLKAAIDRLFEEEIG